MGATEAKERYSSMRARRIENEWHLLEALQKANSGRLRLTRCLDLFWIEAANLPALLRAPSDPANPGPVVKLTHRLRIVFPRYYPSMPVEVYLDEPVFHPNVHPDTGFVCLWVKHRIQTTLEHARRDEGQPGNLGGVNDLLHARLAAKEMKNSRRFLRVQPAVDAAAAGIGI